MEQGGGRARRQTAKQAAKPNEPRTHRNFKILDLLRLQILRRPARGLRHEPLEGWSPLPGGGHVCSWAGQEASVLDCSSGLQQTNAETKQKHKAASSLTIETKSPSD